MKNNINVQTLKCKDEEFFKIWLLILQPFLKLRNQEVTVLASLLYFRYTIAKDVKNTKIIDELLFNTRTKNEIKKKLKMETYAFNNILSSLRKKKIVVNNSINSKIIPSVEQGFKNFKLVYNIEII